MTNLCGCGCGEPTQARRFIWGHLRRMPEYRAYHHAKDRCTNLKSESWNNYGGRGIRFLFTSFEQFFAELGLRPEGMSLDRIENDGNYEPGNVRWATTKEQLNNQRTPANALYKPFKDLTVEERRAYHRAHAMRSARSSSENEPRANQTNLELLSTNTTYTIQNHQTP